MSQVNYTGTSHFFSLMDAYLYYKPYYGNDYKETLSAVRDKIAAKEITIGAPIPIQRAGYLSTVFLNTIEGRYFIKETKV